MSTRKSFSAVVLAAVAALAATGVSFAATESIGTVASVTRDRNGASLTTSDGALVLVQFSAADTVRVRINPSGKLAKYQTGAMEPAAGAAPDFEFIDDPSALLMATPKAVVIIRKDPFQVIVLRSDKTVAIAGVPGGVFWDRESGQTGIRHLAPEKQAYFGLGARGGPINRRGRTIYMRNVDRDAYSEFSDPLYITIPYFYGLEDGRAYGVFLDNPGEPFFDMDSQKTGEIMFGCMQGELNYYVFTGPKPADVALAYAKLTGFNQLPPKWSLGYHQSRYGYQSAAEYLELAKNFRAYRFPCDVLWFDIDYMDELQKFTWNTTKFPNPVEMNSTLDRMGFRRVNIIEPLMTVQDRLWPLAAGSRFLLENPDGTPFVTAIWYGDVSFIDFTKTAVRSWYKELLKQFLTYGIDGIWNDLNEPAQNYMPQVVYDYDGERRTDLPARNVYSTHQVSLSDQALRELRPRTRPWVISRSGYSGIQRYSANWSGDTLTSFDSLRVSLQMTLSMGISGQNFFGHDIGGFLGSPSPELFVRWLEFGSYIPLFRTHSTNTTAPREPWSFGEPVGQYSREVINQRYRLLPYIYSVYERAATTAEPVVAPLFFRYPADTATYSVDDEFMLGPYLLVAPVVADGERSRTVYLPAGHAWYDRYTGRRYAGGTRVVVEAPLDRIPVFVREGAVLPSGEVLQYAYDPSAAPLQTIELYPGADETFHLYEDDGITTDFTNGIFTRTQLSRSNAAGVQSFIFKRTTKGWQPPTQSLHIIFHDVNKAPAFLVANGQFVPPAESERDIHTNGFGWFYRAGERKLMVRYPAYDSVEIVAAP